MPTCDLARWSALCRSIHATRNVREIFDRLVSEYRDRPYHNLDHVSQCLREFDRLAKLAKDPHALESALWFHDAIYDSRANDNEERSAQLATDGLARMGVTGQFPLAVQSLILLTKHNRKPKGMDQSIIIDVDLSILGQQPDVFDRYEAGVRKEYAWLSDDEFWPKRKTFLKNLLARDTLYHTDLCLEKYEAAARRNLQRSIDRIEGLV
jgi:predicted metal-dependent HD superfamily phosphohydrolase